MFYFMEGSGLLKVGGEFQAEIFVNLISLELFHKLVSEEDV